MNGKVVAALIVAYVIGAVLTFGHETNRFEKKYADNPVSVETAAVPGFCAAVLWPIYVPLRLSYVAFK